MLGSRFRLAPGSTLEIGRSHTSDVSLPDVASISRHHARLGYVGGAVLVEDLGSTNGTWVNDQLIAAPTVMRSGDRFQVGAVHFKLLHERDVEHAYHAAVYELMIRDGLTQALNKQKFEEEARRECARAVRYGRPLVLILIDVDHFKAINDGKGHLCGDMVLRRTAEVIRTTLRAEQGFGRIGGEEFAVLCPESDAEAGRVVAERLREAIARQQHTGPAGPFQVTCSFGVAELTGDRASFEDLYEAADRALYASKKAGRDRVTVGEPPTSSTPRPA